MAQIGINIGAVAPQTRIEPVPAGDYLVMITESDIASPKSGTGLRFTYTLTILEGEQVGRKVFDGENIQHPNKQTQDIGQARMAAICHAVGVPNAQDTQQLHGIPFHARIKLRPAEGQYEARNEVGSVAAKDAAGSAAAPMSTSTPPSSPPQPAAAPAAKKGAPPWMNSKKAA